MLEKDNMQYRAFDYDYEHRSLRSLSTMENNPAKKLPSILWYTRLQGEPTKVIPKLPPLLYNDGLMTTSSIKRVTP